MRKYILGFIVLLFAFKSYSQSSKFNHIVNYYKTQKQFNGSVLVAKGGKILFSKSTGLADRQHGVEINTKSRFKIASITKTFTALLILQLYEQGKLDLQATIGTYLPQYQGKGKNKVTIHHL